MKFTFAVVAFIVVATSAVAQTSGLDLLGRKLNAMILPADPVALGQLGKLNEATKEVEWLTSLIAGDLPFDLPHGSYILERPTGDREIYELTEDNPVGYIVANYEPGPFGTYEVAGQLYRTDGFSLRNPEDNLELLQSRWPYFRKQTIFPVLRPDVGPAEHAKGLERFRQSIETHFESVSAILGEGMLMDLPTEDRFIVLDLSQTLLSTALAGLAATGTPADVTAILDRAEHLAARGVIIWEEFVETAISIESRHNILDSGQAATRFDRYLEGEDSPIYPHLVNKLAEKGYRPALAYLISALPTGDLPPLWNNWDRSRAFTSLVRFESPDLYEFSLRIIAAYREEKIRSLSGEPWQSSELQIEFTSVMEPALLYAATRTSEDINAVSFPIPQSHTYLMSLAPALKDPSQLLEYFLSSGEAFEMKQLSAMVCPAIYGRSSDPELLDRMYSIFLKAATDRDHIRPAWLASSVMSIGMANCLVSQQGMNFIDGNMEKRRSMLPLPWHYSFGSISQDARNSLEYSVPHINRYQMDHAPDRWVNEGLADLLSKPGAEDYLRYRDVVTTSGNFETGPYTGNAMLRMFLQPFHDQIEDDRQVWALGEVALRIDADPNDDLVYFGLSVQAAGYAENGLAATIARDPELIAKNVKNGGIPMIEKVVFRNLGGSSELEFIGTMSSGIHAYTLKGLDTDLADAVVDVYFAPKDLDDAPLNQWTVSFPLHSSPFAFESRLHSGKISFQ